MYRKSINIITEKEFTDITNSVQKIVDKYSIVDGVIFINTLHTTCGLKIMENEILSLFDIDSFLNEIVPINKDYAHDKIHLRQVPIDERINARSHIKVLFFNTNLNIQIINGKLNLGEWQRIMLVEMDCNLPSRERNIVITLLNYEKD